MNDLVSTLDKSLQNNNKKSDFINIEQFYTTDIQIFCFIDIQILRQFNNYNILKILEEKFKKLYILNGNIKICCIVYVILISNFLAIRKYIQLFNLFGKYKQLHSTSVSH